MSYSIDHFVFFTPITGFLIENVAAGSSGSTQYGVVTTDPQAWRVSNDPIVEFVIVTGSLPPGMTMTGNAYGSSQIEGTPTASGTYNIVIQLQYPLGNISYYSIGDRYVDTSGNVFVVTVAGLRVGGTPAWNTTSIGALTSDGAVTWEYAGLLVGNLPEQSLTIQVLPTAPSTYFNIDVLSACNTVNGQKYFNYLQATGSSSSYSFKITSESLPIGLYLASINRGTNYALYCQILGVPNDISGYYTFSITATGNLGDSVTQLCSIFISPFQIAAYQFYTSCSPALYGIPYSFQLNQSFASYPGSSGYAFEHIGVPPYTFSGSSSHFSISSSGLVTGTPPSPSGPFSSETIQVTITDSLGNTMITEPLIVIFSAVPPLPVLSGGYSYIL